MSCVGSPELPCGVSAVGTLKPLGTVGLLLRAVCRRLCPASLRLFEDYSDLQKHAANADIVVLFDYKGLEALIRRVDEIAPQARKIVYYWNALGNQKPVAAKGWEIWTFDPEDAARHGLKYGGQFFFELPLPTSRYSVDLCFTGRNKGRFPFLRHLAAALSQAPAAAHLKVDFRLVSPLAYVSKRYSRPLGFKEYIAVETQARALLEVNAPGQTGLTLRALEALGSGRKLVTTNSAIKQYSFYSPENIHILDPRPDIDALIAFLNDETPLRPVDMSQFTFSQWLSRLGDNITCPGYFYKP